MVAVGVTVIAYCDVATVFTILCVSQQILAGSGCNAALSCRHSAVSHSEIVLREITLRINI